MSLPFKEKAPWVLLLCLAAGLSWSIQAWRYSVPDGQEVVFEEYPFDDDIPLAQTDGFENNDEIDDIDFHVYPRNVYKWKVEDVLHWLAKKHLDDLVPLFKVRKINGATLLSLGRKTLGFVSKLERRMLLLVRIVCDFPLPSFQQDVVSPSWSFSRCSGVGPYVTHFCNHLVVVG
jgi:hypothetical protein